MESTSIIVHLALIGALFYRGLSVRFHWLTLIGVLGLAFTVLFHHLDPNSREYFNLYYAVSILMVGLYVACSWQLRRTEIAASMVLYVAMKFVVWFFTWRNMEDCRMYLQQFMRPLNIVFIGLWAWAIIRYEHRQRTSARSR